MANTIKCKNCGTEIEVSEALRHQVEEQLLNAERKKHQTELETQRKDIEAKAAEKAEKDLAKEIKTTKEEAEAEKKRSKDLLESIGELTKKLKEAEQTNEDVKLNTQKQIDEAKSKIRQDAKEEFSKQQSVEIEDIRKQLNERDEKLEEYKKSELDLRQEKRALEQKEKDLELTAQRKIDQERRKIEEETSKRLNESHDLKDKEKEKVIADLKKAVEEAQRKANIGSQQLQGEVLEIDIENELRAAFPEDEIEPVAKGTKGADAKQLVKSPKGFDCGKILWESKRTKVWSEGWITKLKADQRAEKANVAALVSIVPPKDIKHPIEFRNGVWVCRREFLLPLATLLRKALLEVGLQKAIAVNKGSKAENLYAYITSHEFVQQLEIMIETYQDMQQQVQKERTAYEKLWAQREGQTRRMLNATANMVGSMQGELGQNAMPRIKGLELLEGGDTSEDKDDS